jgi:hypothetical protein
MIEWGGVVHGHTFMGGPCRGSFGCAGFLLAGTPILHGLPTLIGVGVSGKQTLRRSHTMNSTALVPVFTGTIQHQSTQLCNAHYRRLPLDLIRSEVIAQQFENLGIT